MKYLPLNENSLLHWYYVSPDRTGQVCNVHAFGLDSNDLDIDFKQTSRPHLVTQLLLGCLQQANLKNFSADEIWSWSLKQRLQALLVIVMATSGKTLSLQVHCQQPSCNELFELMLDLNTFQKIEDKDCDNIISCLIEDNEIKMRLPTGNDQLEWLQQVSSVQLTQLATQLIKSVNGQQPEANWQVPKAWLNELSAVLDRHDELMNLKLHASCPACNSELLLVLDLEEKLLNVIAADQKKLFKQIHQLASCYHWTEADIMSLTPHRRFFYLSQLEDGAWA